MDILFRLYNFLGAFIDVLEIPVSVLPERHINGKVRAIVMPIVTLWKNCVQTLVPL